MARSILCLPNEVLLHIIEGIPNADLDSFTSSCKLLHNLAYNVLRDHQMRKRTYSSITYGNPERNEKATTWIHPTLMLRDLQRDDLLCYPTKLSVNDHRNEGAEWDDGRDHPVSDDPNGLNYKSKVDYALEHFPKHIGPLVKACPYINGDKALTNAILEDGDIGATLGLLLNILPRLTDLMITDYNGSSDGGVNFKRILDRMVIDSNSSMSGAQGEYRNSGCKLNNITLTRSDEGASFDKWDLSMHAPLFYTPSMRSIRVEYLRAHEEVWNHPGLRSRLEILDIYRPATDIKSLNTYLGASENLTDFCYDTGIFGGGHFLLISLVRSLAVHTSHSLRRLKLGHECFVLPFNRLGGLFIGSLRMFQVLQSIQVEGVMLIKPVEAEANLTLELDDWRPGNPQQLTNMLPASLISLTLRSTAESYRSQDMTNAIHMLRDLPARKAEALPNLKVIRLESGFPGLEEDGVMLLRACGEAGVTISDCSGSLN